MLTINFSYQMRITLGPVMHVMQVSFPLLQKMAHQTIEFYEKNVLFESDLCSKAESHRLRLLYTKMMHFSFF